MDYILSIDAGTTALRHLFLMKTGDCLGFPRENMNC